MNIPNWDSWFKEEAWTLGESILLLLNIDPDSQELTHLPDTYADIESIAIECIGNGTLRTTNKNPAIPLKYIPPQPYINPHSPMGLLKRREGSRIEPTPGGFNFYEQPRNINPRSFIKWALTSHFTTPSEMQEWYNSQHIEAVEQHEWAPPNWDYWTKQDLWTLSEAAFLLLEVDPQKYTLPGMLSSLPSDICRTAHNIKKTVITSWKAGKLKVTHGTLCLESECRDQEQNLEPLIFITWATSKGYDIPEGMSPIEQACDEADDDERCGWRRRYNSSLILLCGLYNKLGIELLQGKYIKEAKTIIENVGLTLSDKTIRRVLRDAKSVQDGEDIPDLDP